MRARVAERLQEDSQNLPLSVEQSELRIVLRVQVKASYAGIQMQYDKDR